jgi:glycosyltransferase involved in cell wall biosynthesis
MMRVSILMGLYNYNEEYLRQQLKSLNDQTYSNIELIICDDASPENDFETTKRIIYECITRFPFRLKRNPFNIGYNANFEQMIGMATGEFISFCDNDDVWYKDKVKNMMDLIMCTPKCVLAYCRQNFTDSRLIPNEDINDANPYALPEKFYEHGGIHRNKKMYWTRYYYFMFHHILTGCCMMVKRSVAVKAVPFPENIVYYDQWMGIFAVTCGSVAYLDEPLIYYRRHDDTQTGTLKGIESKEDYYLKQLLPMRKFYVSLLNERPELAKKIPIREAVRWTDARIKYWKHHSLTALLLMHHYSAFNRKYFLFEAIAGILPDSMFKNLRKLVIKNNYKGIVRKKTVLKRG